MNGVHVKLKTGRSSGAGLILSKTRTDQGRISALGGMRQATTSDVYQLVSGRAVSQATDLLTQYMDKHHVRVAFSKCRASLTNFTI